MVHKFGLDGLWYRALMVILGLGFVIFIHELGHFLTAKWCDVHVQTFSIGFGPALPGCSFQRGETTYKIAVLPLGGYVNMVGEGPEADEDEDYPRSFKNKTVGQRMLIISAGVIMNVLLGAVLLRRRVSLSRRGPAARRRGTGRCRLAGLGEGRPQRHGHHQAGQHRASLLRRPPNRGRPVRHGETIPFVLLAPDGTTRLVDLEPRRDAHDLNPIIGLSPPHRMQLLPARAGRACSRGPSCPTAPRRRPARCRCGPASSSWPPRPIPTTPKTCNPLKTTLPPTPSIREELARRFLRLSGRKCLVKVQAADGKTEERELPLTGFEWGDVFVGTTRGEEAAARPCNPFAVSPLPMDNRDGTGRYADPFAYHKRMVQLAGLPLVIQVRRAGARPTVRRWTCSCRRPTTRPSACAWRWARWRRCAMTRRRAAGLQKDDLLLKVQMTDSQGKVLHTWDDLDPERLPHDLAQKARETPGDKQVTLTVRRPDHPDSITLPPIKWDDSWDFDEESPQGTASPLAVRQLGLAYWVMSRVVEVKDGGPAAAAGLQRGDKITRVRFREMNITGTSMEWNSEWEMESREDEEKKVYGRWANVFWLLQMEFSKNIQFTRRGDDGKESDPKEMQGRPDPTWPVASRGLTFEADLQTEKANSLAEALEHGRQATLRDIKLMYLQVRSLVKGGFPPSSSAAPSPSSRPALPRPAPAGTTSCSFMAVISINLAVVNFLPIPVLDGGHMVF